MPGYSSVDVLKGWLDSFSFGLPQCWGCLSCSQGVSLNFSLFRARLCWGGSVAFFGFCVYAGGAYAFCPNVMLLVEMTSGMNGGRSKMFDIRTGIRLLISALIYIFTRDGEAGPFHWLARVA